MKKSFAMLFAIGFVVVLGTVGMMMMYFSSQTTQQVTDNYLDLQGQLYVNSANEFAMQALEARDYKNYGCINKIDMNTSLYEVNMTFHYFLSECPIDCNCSVIKTRESNGTVMVNTYVKVKDGDIRIFNQTLLKP